MLDLHHPVPPYPVVTLPANVSPFDIAANSACSGGLRNGHHCHVNSDCRVCDEGSNKGLPCSTGTDCPGGACPKKNTATCLNPVGCTAVNETNPPGADGQGGCARWV